MAADKSWIQFFDANKRGRDFVVGDLHGCFDALVNLLSYANFNPRRDRLFSVGDLVDRGDQTPECLDLLRKPWFFAARGNHEQMILDFWDSKDKNPYDPRWISDIGDDMIQEWRKVMSRMPYVLKIGSGQGAFYVLHAELWEKGSLLTEAMIDDFNFSDSDSIRSKCLWSRHVIGTHWRKSRNRFHDPELPRIFCGHTIVQMPILVENSVYMDTGAFAPYLDPNNAHAEHFGLSMIEVATLNHWFAPTCEHYRGTVIEMGRVCAELAAPTLFVDDNPQAEEVLVSDEFDLGENH